MTTVSPSDPTTRMTNTEHPLVQALYGVEGKAEIIHGEIVRFMSTGFDPNFAAGGIFVSLRLYAKRAHRGHVGTDNLGFIVDLPHRMSFSPDVAYFTNPTTGMKFIEGASDFAVEVRSENDYGPAAEREMAAKRADYFAAGTLVVWDVDLLSDGVIRVYRDGNAEHPGALYRKGELADAEPAVPGWTMPVHDLFTTA